jgi:hypothetical protein
MLLGGWIVERLGGEDGEKEHSDLIHIRSRVYVVRVLALGLVRLGEGRIPSGKV